MAIKMKGTFLYFDRENDNGRIYKKENISAIIEAIENIKESKI
jgi:hypothetical protein